MPVGAEISDRDITVPQFFTEPQPDDAATKAHGGVPQFKDVYMIRILMPGIRDEVVRPVEEKDKQRWPLYWDRFIKGEKHQVEGTPLSEFATATESERMTLKASGLQTVEQVAGLGDDAAGRLHVVAIRNKAQKFLATREQFGNTGKLTAEIETLKKRNEALEQKVKELENANHSATVSGRDADNGVHAPVVDYVEPVSGREALGGNRQRGRKRPGDGEELEKADI